jgi:X-Pro dipeptidyl-peptidase
MRYVTLAPSFALPPFARVTEMASTPSTCVFRNSLMTVLVVAATALPAWAVAQTVPVFVDGQAQVVPAFSDPSQWIRHDLWVETSFDSDGDDQLDRVHVDITRPIQTETEGLRVPVVYESSPYYSGVGGANPQYFWDVRQEVGEDPPPRTPLPSIQHLAEQPVISLSHVATWVPRGFAVVHSQSPGTGQSQGCPTVGGENESLAPKAVIDWLNGRARGFTSVVGGDEVTAEWSSGKVGMTGTSYNGTLPLAAATTGVDGLEAIIPISPNTSYYHYYRSYGLVRSPGGYLGEDVDVLFDFIDSGSPTRRDYCISTVREADMKANQDRKTGDYNDFWAGRDYLNHIDGVKAALLMAHGFNDWNVMPEHSYRISQALKERGVPVQMFYHQGGHGGPPPLEQMNRWFSRYLYGVENGVEQDPKAWIVREGDDAADPTPYPDYPHPDAAGVRLNLAGDGTGIGSLSTETGASQGQAELVDDVAFDGAALARAERSTHRLLYATPELTEAVHLSGLASVRIRLAANRPAANLSVWLVALPWVDDGAITDNIITRGWADPQNSESLRVSEPLVPGEFVELEFNLQPDDQVIPAGQRIGLMIFSSDREFTLWPQPGTELTIDLESTTIELPVVGGLAAFERAAPRPIS